MILFFHLLVLSAVSGQSNDGDDLFTSRDTWGRGLCKPGGNHVTCRDTGSWSGTLPSLSSWQSKMSLLHNGFTSTPYLIRCAIFSGTVLMWPSARHSCFGFRLQCLDYDIHTSQKITSSVFSHQSPSFQYEVILRFITKHLKN